MSGTLLERLQQKVDAELEQYAHRKQESQIPTTAY